MSNPLAFCNRLADLIEIEVKRRNTSVAQFSREITGNDALLKNLKKGSIPSPDRLSRILSELGLSLTLGVPIHEPHPIEPSSPPIEDVKRAVLSAIEHAYAERQTTYPDRKNDSPRAEESVEFPSLRELTEMARRIRTEVRNKDERAEVRVILQRMMDELAEAGASSPVDTRHG